MKKAMVPADRDRLMSLFLQRVKFNKKDILQRRTDNSTWPAADMRVWKKPDWATGGEMEGFIVGIRTLSNGTVNGWYDEGAIYKPTHTFKAFLVVFDQRKNPVLLLPEDVEVVVE